MTGSIRTYSPSINIASLKKKKQLNCAQKFITLITSCPVIIGGDVKRTSYHLNSMV